MNPSKRAQRVFHLLIMLTMLVTSLDWMSGGVAAQDIPGTPVMSEEASLDLSAPEPTDVPVESSTDVADWQMDVTTIPPPTDTPGAIPPTEPVVTPTEAVALTQSVVVPTSISTNQPDTPTPTMSPTVAIAPVSAAVSSVDTAVLVTVSVEDQNGPKVAGVCMTLADHTVFHILQWSACTDANGQALLHVLTNINGTQSFTIHIDQPAGYLPVGDMFVGTSPGQTTQAALVLYPLPPVTDMLKAVDAVDGAPIGGACWTYYANDNGTPGALAIGPICDADNDGATSVTGISPSTAYCLMVTPPNDYQIVGSNTICSTGRAEGMTTIKALTLTGEIGTGTAKITVMTQWNAPLPDVCVSVSLQLNGQDFSVTSDCTDADGIMTLTGLIDGSYVASPLSWPNYFERFQPIVFTISDGGSANVPIVEPSVAIGVLTFKSYFSYGPQTVGGVCWSYVLNDGDSPGSTVLAGPVCDTDGDGIATLTGAPAVPFCLVATPPAGFYRPDDNYSYCSAQASVGSATITIGLVPIPVTPTPTSTGTATPPPSPTPTQTPPPTPTPAPNEPIGDVLVRNCSADYAMPDGSTYLKNEMCYTVGAGIRFAIFQSGVQIGEVTTNDSGSLTVDLPARQPYELHYMNGNGSIWVPFTGQETLQRYGAKGQYLFSRDASIDRAWTMTVNVVTANGGESYQPLGGACFKIIDDTGAERLANVCDTDNDGVIIVGQLPPVDVHGTWGNAISYSAVMTQAPPGYSLFTTPIGGGAYDPANPNSWIAKYSYSTNSIRIHAVDPDGNPVPGFCMSGPDWVYGGMIKCDGPGGPSDSTADYAADGIVTYAGVERDRVGTYRVYANPAGYRPDVATINIATTSDPFIDVTIIFRSYGSVQLTTADLRVQLAAIDPTVDSFDYATQFITLCFSLTPDQRQLPSGTLCPSKTGELLFRNVPQGSYSLTLVSNHTFCLEDASAPVTTPVTIGASDLGNEVKISIPVTGCGDGSYAPHCATIRNSPTGRIVNAYYGTLTDSSGTVLVNTLQLSEAVSQGFTESLLNGDNIDPIHLTSASLAPWSEPPVGAANWVTQPDWDGNAYQSMLNAFGQSSSDYSLGEPISHGSQTVMSGVSSELFFPDPETFRQDYPEFTECPDNTGLLIVSYTHTNTLNLYELNATENTPTTPPPSPYPSPEPLCNTTVERNVTAYYGTLTDDQSGDMLMSGLALSDHIPPALSNAIASSDAPGPVGNDIGNWVGSGLLDESWAESASEQLDAEGNLRAQLSRGSSLVTFGSPSAGQTVEYRYTTYRYLDITNLPEGCTPSFPEQTVRSASLSVLIPISQETVVNVIYVELDARRGGNATSTATTTATATPTVGATTIPGVTATTVSKSSDPTASTSPTGIQGLPNTGAHPGFSGQRSILIALLLLAMLAACSGIIQRRRS